MVSIPGPGHTERGSKRHARRRDDPDSPLYWAGNPEHWAELRREPRPPLVCPERCGVELVSVERHVPYLTRFFRVKPPLECDHWEMQGGGGPESPEHLWLKKHLAALVRELEYDAIEEHWPTRADVYVESSPPYALEIQRWQTRFSGRTAARQMRGARTCWLMSKSVSIQGVARAVRFSVIDMDGRDASPWDHSEDSALDTRAWVIVIDGNIALPPAPDALLEPGHPWFNMWGFMTAQEFLAEILSGRREWRGREDGLRMPGWVLDTDLDAYREYLRNSRRANEMLERRRRSALADAPVATTRPAVPTAAGKPQDQVTARHGYEVAGALIDALGTATDGPARELVTWVRQVRAEIAEVMERQGPRTLIPSLAGQLAGLYDVAGRPRLTISAAPHELPHTPVVPPSFSVPPVGDPLAVADDTPDAVSADDSPSVQRSPRLLRRLLDWLGVRDT